MRRIWKRSEIDASKSYVLKLFDDGLGTRDFEICALDRLQQSQAEPGLVLVTQPVPMDLVLRGDVFGIAEQVRLDSGRPFFFDSNGVWLTHTEWRDLEAGSEQISWARGCQPTSSADR
jgi:hypothetical protein